MSLHPCACDVFGMGARCKKHPEMMTMTNPEDTGAGEKARPSASTIRKVQAGMRRYHRENPGNNCRITLAAEWCIAAEIDAPSAPAVAPVMPNIYWCYDSGDQQLEYCDPKEVRAALAAAAPSGAAGVGVSEVTDEEVRAASARLSKHDGERWDDDDVLDVLEAFCAGRVGK